MNFLNSIYYKSLAALYRLNTNKDGRAKSIVIDAVFEGLVCGKEGLDQAKLQMALDTATGDWLDFWGNHYGVPRFHKVKKKNLYLTADGYHNIAIQDRDKSDIYYHTVDEETLTINGIHRDSYYESEFHIEEDDSYRVRIIEEIISAKNTIPALKKATARYIKHYEHEEVEMDSIDIFEPWTQLLKFDTRGVLDGSGRMISYDYWNYAVIDISMPESSLITEGLIKYLNKVKAGGVKIVFTISPDWGLAIDPSVEDKRNNIWNSIYRETMIQARRAVDGFRFLMQGNLDLIDDVTKGGQFDIQGKLDGNRMIYWDGVEVQYEWYTSGLIRNPFNSAVLSLEDYKKIANNPNLTIEGAARLEYDSINRKKLYYSHQNSNLIEDKLYLDYDRNVFIHPDDYADLVLANEEVPSVTYHISDITEDRVSADIYTGLNLNNKARSGFRYHVVKNKDVLAETITRDGLLSMTQSYLGVFHEWLDEFDYFPFSKSGSTSGSVLDLDSNEMLKYVTAATLNEIQEINPDSTEVEFIRILREPKRNPQILELIRRDVIEKIKTSNYEESIQNELMVYVAEKFVTADEYADLVLANSIDPAIEYHIYVSELISADNYTKLALSGSDKRGVKYHIRKK